MTTRMPAPAVPIETGLVRCRWCTDDPLYVRYHDTEWGVPSRDPRHLFEMLILEGFQAGLSWLTILRRREALRAAGANARAWLALPDPVGLVWSVVGGQPVVHHYAVQEDAPVAGPEAEALSRLLKRHGFTFVGPTICQSYLQAIGCLMDHTTDCHRHRALAG